MRAPIELGQVFNQIFPTNKCKVIWLILTPFIFENVIMFVHSNAFFENDAYSMHRKRYIENGWQSFNSTQPATCGVYNVYDMCTTFSHSWKWSGRERELICCTISEWFFVLRHSTQSIVLKISAHQAIESVRLLGQHSHFLHRAAMIT